MASFGVCDPGKGSQVLHLNEMTMTSLCRAAAGITGKMPIRHLAPHLLSPTQGQGLGSHQCFLDWKRPRGRLRHGSGPTLSAKITDSLASLLPRPCWSACKTQGLTILLTRGCGRPRWHHDTSATVFLQSPRLKLRTRPNASSRSHWLLWV